MSDSLLSFLAVLFLLACLCALIAGCGYFLRSADEAIRRQLGKPKSETSQARWAITSSITADEIIDLHQALQQITDLRAIAQEVTIG